METRHVSVHYARASWRHRGHYKHAFPKLTALCDVKSHLVLAAVVDRGPKPDVVEFPRVVAEALTRHRFRTVIGDAGYESEKAHVFCRERLGVRSIFPTTRRGRPRADGRPRRIISRYRRELHEDFPSDEYGQRWQVETVFSMIKRNLGSALKSRKPFSINREVVLKVITHNLMILQRHAYLCFQRSNLVPRNPRTNQHIMEGHDIFRGRRARHNRSPLPLKRGEGGAC